MTALRKAIDDVEVRLSEQPSNKPADIIDIVLLLGDRAALARKLESRWRDEKAELVAESEPAWQNLRALDAIITEGDVDAKLIADLERLVEGSNARAKTIGRTYQVISDMVDGLIRDVTSPERPEELVRFALSFTLKPHAFRYEDAIEQRDFLLGIQARIDPEMQRSGEILDEGDDLQALFAEHAHDEA